MSREIKFRAWHKRAKEYREIETIDFLKCRADCITTRDISTGHDPWGDVIEEVILEECTGLKDKNSKEIYEGDIVEMTRSYGYGFLPKGGRAVVKFDKKELCYKLTQQGQFRLTARKTEGLKIIGNIHEKPELLGGQNEIKR